MSSLRVTGSRSLIIICDCGEEHKLTTDKNGEYQLGTTPKKPVKPAAAVEPGKRKRKLTIFDGFGDDDAEETPEKDDDD